MAAKPRMVRGVTTRAAAGMFVALAVSIPTGSAGQQPQTGTVAGQVTVVSKSTRRLMSPGAYPGRVVAVPGEHDASELPNVVVFVRSGPVPSPAMRATIRQTNEEFLPHLVAVTTGSTVDFPNDDLIFHNVFSLSRAEAFDLGRFPRGSSKSRTFRKPGLVKVFCNLHSHMSALVRVFDHPYFAIPDAQGRFAIADVPAGRQEVVAWHERAGEVTLPTAVAAGGSSDLSFSLPLTDKKK